MKNLCVLGTTKFKVFAACANFTGGFLPFSNRRLGLFSRQDAKNAKFGKHFFFAAFAPLREIFRFWLRLGHTSVVSHN